MAKTIKTVEIDGFELDIDVSVFADFEFLESLADVANGEPANVIRPFRMLFAGDTYQKVKDHLRDEDGRVPVKAMSTFLSKVVKAAAPNF
jgi:hypothetical protein